MHVETINLSYIINPVFIVSDDLIFDANGKMIL